MFDLFGMLLYKHVLGGICMQSMRCNIDLFYVCHFFTHPNPQTTFRWKVFISKSCFCFLFCLRVKFVCVFTPWFVTCCSPIPLKSKVSLPPKLPLKRFHFPKRFCVCFPFRCWEFLLCKHASGVHGSPTRVCYFVIFHVKSMLEETGGSQPRGGREATKINPAKGKKKQRERKRDGAREAALVFNPQVVSRQSVGKRISHPTKS